MALLRQTSFAAGELSPYLHGRTDLELFGHGARKLFNFFVSAQGSAVSRPGTELVSTAKTPNVVLAPFVIPNVFIPGEMSSYVLEFGALYVRVHSADTGYLGIELVTPYREEDLPGLQWAQAGYLLTITHAAHRPREIAAPLAGIRTDWLIRFVSFAPPCDSETSILRTPVAPWWKTSAGALVTLPYAVSNPVSSLFVLDATHPPMEWRWMVSASIRHRVTGEVAETYAVAIGRVYNGSDAATVVEMPGDGFVVLYDSAPVLFRHPSFGAPSPAAANWDFVGVNYYRGRGGVYGWVGSTEWAQDFLDTGAAPNFALPPLRSSSDPFISGNPAACAYFQGRRMLASTERRASTVWGSGVDDWQSYDLPNALGVVPDAPVEMTLSSRKWESIRSMVAHRRLVVTTDASIWSVGGSDGPLTPTSMEFRLEDEVGASQIQPLVVDGAVLYVRSKGRGVRALSLTDGNNYSAQDITWHAEHLFRAYGSEIVSWCFQRDPWAVIWAVQADGSLLSCTRTGATTWAWARQETGSADAVKSVACVPGTRSDAVVLAVTRGGVTYLERMTTRDRESEMPLDFSSGDAAFALDCTDAHSILPGVSTVIGGLSRFEGRDVWAVAPGNPPQGPLRVVGGEVTLAPSEVINDGDAGVLVRVGLPFVADLELLDAAPSKTAQKTVVKVGFEVDSAQGLEVGEDFGHLVPWRQRSAGDSYEYPSAASALVVVAVKGSWRKTGRAVLRQSKPLPVIILGVTRELDVGGT
jgi:hypothetical protein